MGARAIFRGFNRPSRVLMINQFGINIGFYMLMPYLADYLAGPLGLAAWAVGLVMGVRNFSQQGMFFVGGTLADRFGYKPLIIAGCLIRTGGFALLVVAQSLPSVLIAAAATGFAGALFNPAVRGYLAAEAGERKIEAFAMFNVFYQSGILLGPLVGLVLLALDFRITVLAAAGVFGLLTVAQLVALPQHRADSEREKTSILQDWRVVVRNRPFLTLAAAMTGCYALSFQIYLALPMQASILMPRNQYLLIAAMFAVSGLVAVGGQLRITRWFAVRWGAERSLVVGATILAASFIPVAVTQEVRRALVEQALPPHQRGVRHHVGGQQRLEFFDGLQAMNQQIGEHRQLVVGNEFDGGLGEQRQRARAGAAGVAGQRRSGRFSGEACYVAGQQYISWTLLLPYLGQHPIYFSTGRCRHEIGLGTGDFTADPEKVLEVAVAEGMMQCPASALGVFGRAANNVHHWHMLGVTARDRIGHRELADPECRYHR